MADLSDAANQASIVAMLDEINNNLTAIHRRMLDGRRVVVDSGGADDPESDLHSAVSATLDLVDACHEIASYLQQIAAILNEKL